MYKPVTSLVNVVESTAGSWQSRRWRQVFRAAETGDLCEFYWVWIDICVV